MTPPSGSVRSRILLGAVIVSHLLLISGQVESGGERSVLTSIVFGAIAPPRRAVSAVYNGTRNAFLDYIDLRDVRNENVRLTARLRLLEAEMNARRRQLQEAERLRILLDLSKRLPFKTIAAELVSAEGIPWSSVVTVNRGGRQGVSLNMPAICQSGVVGRVIEIGPHAAKVQLIIDRDSGIGVLVERSRATGVLEGTTANRTELPMRFVPSIADVVVGDAIVSSGLDQIYPKGLLVGHVSRVSRGDGLLKEVFVAPATRFDQLEEVLLLHVQRPALDVVDSVR